MAKKATTAAAPAPTGGNGKAKSENKTASVSGTATKTAAQKRAANGGIPKRSHYGKFPDYEDALNTWAKTPPKGSEALSSAALEKIRWARSGKVDKILLGSQVRAEAARARRRNRKSGNAATA